MSDPDAVKLNRAKVVDVALDVITAAAMTGPTPKMPVRLVPDALTAMASVDQHNQHVRRLPASAEPCLSWARTIGATAVTRNAHPPSPAGAVPCPAAPSADGS